jgi:hypothetical protein
MLNYYDSGDQDSVVPLLGSRTLIRELAHDLKFKITDPYRVWFHKGQVNVFFKLTICCIFKIDLIMAFFFCNFIHSIFPN